MADINKFWIEKSNEFISELESEKNRAIAEPILSDEIANNQVDKILQRGINFAEYDGNGLINTACPLLIKSRIENYAIACAEAVLACHEADKRMYSDT
jgi:hypothetical protein